MEVSGPFWGSVVSDVIRIWQDVVLPEVLWCLVSLSGFPKRQAQSIRFHRVLLFYTYVECKHVANLRSTGQAF